ncbi:Uncharacterised protein [Mycolicibacterium vanbaalenii]|uniref:PE-PPE domain-containing protein n=1 Tax=Mycolicibacterium vanbaalenii TaxID=110539 RepID=A0A5S9MPF5_MYCVN|nr:PE-PPE domain-containing protein [Mycolicibacterium vanbaalenii]CAA0078349.1 Uncharacterised protein [Mycolicibacterium vanbaalenii]
MKVLTLGGMNRGRVDRLDTALQGYATKRDRIVVDYPQSASATSIPTGVMRLNEHVRKLVAAGRPFELLCSSQGAEVWSEWAEKHADQPDAPSPALLQRIILIGNPRRRLGGRGVGSLSWDWSRITATPETQYRTDDIARHGDRWANADRYPGGKLDLNWIQRILDALRDPHTYYDHVNPQAPGVLRARSGNTAYWVAG